MCLDDDVGKMQAPEPVKTFITQLHQYSLLKLALLTSYSEVWMISYSVCYPEKDLDDV